MTGESFLGHGNGSGGTGTAAPLPGPSVSVSIVRSLLKYPTDSWQWDDAARHAGPDEVEFTLEILAQQQERAITRREELLEKMRQAEESPRRW